MNEEVIINNINALFDQINNLQEQLTRIYLQNKEMKQEMALLKENNRELSVKFDGITQLCTDGFNSILFDGDKSDDNISFNESDINRIENFENINQVVNGGDTSECDFLNVSSEGISPVITQYCEYDQKELIDCVLEKRWTRALEIVKKSGIPKDSDNLEGRIQLGDYPSAMLLAKQRKEEFGYLWSEL